MNLYKSITESSWDISEDERIRMYNLIQSVYGPKWTEKQIENINTATDEKLEKLYNSALKKFKKKQATQKEVSIEDRIPTYVKDSYKEYIRNHTRTFNNKHNSEEELVKAEDNMNRSIKSFIEEYYPDLYIELWKEDLMEETNMNIYENIKKNLKESDGIEVLGYKNQYGYTIQQVYINYPEKTYEVGSITMRNDKTISRKEFLKTIERLKQAGFKEVKRNKSDSNLNEADDYVAGFDEIIDQMSVAEDYSELYSAASLIQDPSIRVDVEQCIEQCEDDGDDVETAYSVTTSDYLDMYAMQGVENTPTAEADYRAELKNERASLDEANLEPQYSTRKSFYGKANVNDDNTLVSYGTPIMKIVDGKIQMLCRPEHLTQTTLRHIREFMQQNGMDPIPRNKLVKMIEEQGNINEAEDANKKFHTVYVVGDWDDADTDAKEVAEGLKKEYPDINVEYKPILDDGIWCVDIIGPYDEVYKLASTWEPLAEYPDENGGYYVEPYKESEEKSPKQNKIPRNWKKISGEMVGDSSGGKAGAKFEITKDEYDRPIMKYEDGKEYQANWSMIRSPEMVKITNVELNETENLKESSNIIWTSETTEDDYDQEELKERYQEYLDTVNSDSYDTQNDADFEPKSFEDWKYDYIADDSYDQWDMKKEDLEENIYPMIDKQINDDILIVSGNYNSNYPDFRKSGNGGKFLNKAEDILDWLGNEDRVEILNNDGIIGVAGYDHDGSISGNLYTVPADDDLLYEIAMKTDYYDKDGTKEDVLGEFSYDVNHGNIDMSDFWGYEDKLIPIKVEW